MAKKRKSRTGGASSATAADDEKNRAFADRTGSKMTVASWQDVMDSEDEFLEGREKILLDEGPVRKRQRKVREEEMQLEASDEEVLGIGDDDDEEEEDSDDFQDDDDVNEIYGVEDAGVEEEYDEDVEITGRTKRGKFEGLEDDETGWGTSRRDLYGEDELDDEEAALAQEQEARRIQQKQLEEMNEADFGFDDTAADWDATAGVDDTQKATGKMSDEHVLERLPEATIADDASPQERAKILKQRYPEFEPLKREFLQLQPTFVELRMAVTESDSPVLAAKYQALASYLGILSMYFALLTSTASKDGKAFARAPVQLRDHEIMQGLIQARSTWTAAEGLLEIESSEEEDSEVEQVMVVPETSRLLKRTKKPKALSAAELAQAASAARRAARLAAVEAEFADMDVDSSNLPWSKKSRVSDHDDDDEHAELEALEAAAKAAKRKSLRFYTSEITQKASKRQARGREVGGDTDIPHRERWYDRQLRLQAEAQQRKEQVMEQRYGKDASGRDTNHLNTNGGNNNDDDDEEYQSLVSRAQKVKSAKKDAAASQYATASAARDADYLASTSAAAIGPDGKRKITYQIAKNKGLAPHRKKDVRNPRVKKRNKYEDKKKKLGSMKAVFKGGPGKGGYQGEMTGIKTGLVKGVKLS